MLACPMLSPCTLTMTASRSLGEIGFNQWRSFDAMNWPDHLIDPNWGGDIHANRSLESNYACRLDGVFGGVNCPGDFGSDYGRVGLVELAEKHADGDYLSVLDDSISRFGRPRDLGYTVNSVTCTIASCSR